LKFCFPFGETEPLNYLNFACACGLAKLDISCAPAQSYFLSRSRSENEFIPGDKRQVSFVSHPFPVLLPPAAARPPPDIPAFSRIRLYIKNGGIYVMPPPL